MQRSYLIALALLSNSGDDDIASNITLHVAQTEIPALLLHNISHEGYCSCALSSRQIAIRLIGELMPSPAFVFVRMWFTLYAHRRISNKKTAKSDLRSQWGIFIGKMYPTESALTVGTYTIFTNRHIIRFRNNCVNMCCWQ